MIPWPKPVENGPIPYWNGNAFVVGTTQTRILSLGAAPSHWSDDLTVLHETEAGKDHPIDLTSRRMAVASMRQLPDTGSLTLLDVGCSSGFVLESLREVFPTANLIGADYISGPLESLAGRMPGLPLLQFDLRQCPLSDSCVEGITCLNVLEHIDDDESALRHLHRILKPGGILHLEVPADPSLYNLYDQHLMHHRRYRMRDLLALAHRLGFKTLRKTHIGFVAFPAFWWVKRRDLKLSDLPASEKKRLVTEQIRNSRKSLIFGCAMRLENFLARFLSFPFGIRCVAVLTKE